MKRIIVLFAFAWLWPCLSMAEIPSDFIASDTGFASNTVIGIAEHNGAIWLATSRGMNVSTDSGQTWILYQDAPGMVSTSISAIHSQAGRVWMSSSHADKIQGSLESISDGLFYSDDDGENWTQINFGPDGLDIPNVWGGFQTIFDITGHSDLSQNEDWLFFAAFAGGLLASTDDGESWRRIYASAGDSIQYNDDSQLPSLRNRYFSVVVDTSHADTIMLWGGTASGVLQYIYAPPEEKLYASRVTAVAGCDLCSDSATNFVYAGTDLGISRTHFDGGAFISRNESDGLSGPYTTAIYDFRDHLFVGSADSEDGSSTGLAISTDFGDSFTPVAGFSEVIGADRSIVEFEQVGERLYLAAEQAGLFVSADSGLSWTRLLVNPDTVASPKNEVYSLWAEADTLFVGTNDGVVRLNLAPDGSVDSLSHYPFPSNPFAAAGVRAITVHQFLDSLGTTVDSVIMWTANERTGPLDSVGVSSVTRARVEGNVLTDQQTFFAGAITNDVGFIGDTVFILVDSGLYTTSQPGSEGVLYEPSIETYLLDSTKGLILWNDTVLAMSNRNDKVLFGTSSALAVMRDSTYNFRIKRGNIDTLGADVVINHTLLNSLNIDSTTITPGLTGDFIPAIRVQHLTAGAARVWVSGRPTGSGFNGIAVGRTVPAFDTSGTEIGVKWAWRAIYDDGFAWNFAFDGDSVAYAATNAGLLVNRGNYDDTTAFIWDTLVITDENGLTILDAEMAVFSVEVAGDNLWVGTAEGTIRHSLVDVNDNELFIVVDSVTAADEVYAYPVPFSPGRGEVLHFRFVVENDANITIEIYDFAMNLVARPIQDIFYPAGYHESAGTYRPTWDGYNGKGDLAAVGVYYFKVSYSTGEERWGKLAVMP